MFDNNATFALLMSSTDMGKSFSRPVDITAQVKNSSWGFWTSTFKGIQPVNSSLAVSLRTDCPSRPEHMVHSPCPFAPIALTGQNENAPPLQFQRAFFAFIGSLMF
jgi:hypothetical protein